MRENSSPSRDSFQRRALQMCVVKIRVRQIDAQHQALEHGAKFSGCTAHFVEEGLDSGPIISQAVVPVLPDDTAESLSARILEEEHRIYPEAIALVLSGQYRIEGRRVIPFAGALRG